MDTTLLAVVFSLVSVNNDLPPGLLSALCFTESSHQIKALRMNDGGSDSLGVCQIKLATAKVVGFNGTPRQLSEYGVNIKYAGKYLKKQISRYHGDIRKAVAAYNSGTFREDKNGLPLNKTYVKKVFGYWTEGK